MYNYSEKHNVLFVHIPKNAGTSIIDSLDMHSTKVKHYPLSVLQSYMDKETFDKSIKIAVIRNPYERMVSYYRYRQNKSQDPLNYPFHLWLRNGKIQYNMLSYDCLPQIKWCTKEDSVDLPKDIDYILNYEKLDEQWKELCEIEKLNVKPLQKLNTSGQYDYVKYYKITEDAVLVNNIFKADCQLFGYDLGEPNDFPLLKGHTEIDNFLRGK